MSEMVGYLLKNPQHAESMGALSSAHTLANHRWDNRVKQIEQWL